MPIGPIEGRFFGVAALLIAALVGCTFAEERGDTAAVGECAGVAQGGMVWVPGGRFTMGADRQYLEEGPEREVAIEGFWIARTEITNAQFARFVAATGYVTLAERPPPAGSAPTHEPGSAVFRVPDEADPRWWRWVPGAQWRHPGGPRTDIAARPNDPVVQVAYADARAYAAWAGVALPSEAQWEYAALGGGAGLREPVDALGRPTANYYQGVFPQADLGTDGYRSRAPVGCFAANGFGLHDMIGNVWEWTATDASRPDGSEPAKVIKGGSYLCADNYCARYRPAARQFQERGLGTDHIGFRVVDNRRPPPPGDGSAGMD